MVRPRDIGLSISPAVGGYDCIIWGATMARAKLPLAPAYLASAIDAARDDVMKVVMHKDANGEYAFQKAIKIPAADRDAALNILARAGESTNCFRPGRRGRLEASGQVPARRGLRRDIRLQLQILSSRAGALGTPLCRRRVGGCCARRDNFIGMRTSSSRSVATAMSVSDSAIRNDDRLSVSVNVNGTIDTQMRARSSRNSSRSGKSGRIGTEPSCRQPHPSAELKRALGSATATRSCTSTATPRRQA
jgi:hypothetical protein